MYVADFETTANTDDCRVWAWGLFEIGSMDNFEYGTDIDSFMERLKKLSKDKETIYFHNLKFDGEFILYWLFTHGWSHVTEKADRRNCTFMTLISDKGAFYAMDLYFKMLKTRQYKVRILDSLKILPLSVAEIAPAFGLPIQKEEIDYTADRPVGHELTPEEISYLRNDCEIVARAIEALHKKELTKMTTAANAMNSYKEIITRKNYGYWYPEPDYDADVRQSYRGGFTYADPRFTGREMGEGIVLDVNSLYPAVMYNCALPYGDPIFFKGQYKQDSLYQLYVQMIICNFRLKPGHIPTIQIKYNAAFVPTEYLIDSRGEDVALCLTSVDLALFFEHYEIYNIEYVSGWKWKASTILFKDYIDKWYAEKQEATIEHNPGRRTIAKLMLNSLYGKFGMNPKTRSKIPVYNRLEDRVQYVYGEWEERKPVYIPLASFVTAWARYQTITAAQSVYDRFMYADTDSLHLLGTEIPPELDVDPVRLGAWKHEATFTRAKYLRAKSYVEEVDGKLNITCAGLPADCYDQVTFENFSENAVYTGKLRPVHTAGGIVLEEINFSIRKGR